MIDEYRRTIDYLRISITDRCNLRCVYCMPRDGVPELSHGDILRYEEILRLGGIFAALGVTKYKVTGGEPLARRGVADFVAKLKALPGAESVTLTTNGVLLAGQMDALVRAGLDGVNISLDTLDPEQFARLTRVGRLEDTLAGLRSALDAPGLNVKINCVSAEETLPQAPALARLAQDRPVAVRFIELMPIGLGRNMRMCGEDTVRAALERALGPLTPCGERLGNGPAHYFTLPGFRGRIGFISAVSHQFCDRCNRVRLTADGRLKTCLQYESGCDLRALLRAGAGDGELRQAIVQAIGEKPAHHHFSDSGDENLKERLGMSRIGG